MGRCTCIAVALGVLAAGCSRPSHPAPESNAPAVVQIATGTSHTCALLAEGTVRCWGYNAFGQLGDGTNENRWTPTPVSSLSGATAIAAGDRHTCALLVDGTARCWGSNWQNALGDETDTPSSTPVAVRDVEGAATVAAPGASILSTRLWHTCALRADATALCWGYNVYGQLGNNSDLTAWTADPVVGLTGVRSIVAGRLHTCALLEGGSAKCWGLNDLGRLGSVGSYGTCDLSHGERPCAAAPVPVSSAGIGEAITAGDEFTLMLFGGAVAGGWGSNSDGQFATTSVASSPTPMPLDRVWSVGTLAAGGAHACAIRLEGGVLCWGRNDHGQLGHGAPDEHGLGLVQGVDAISLAASAGHTCAVTRGRGVRCWGQNDQGQLGDGTTTERRTPVIVIGLDG